MQNKEKLFVANDKDSASAIKTIKVILIISMLASVAIGIIFLANCIQHISIYDTDTAVNVMYVVYGIVFIVIIPLALLFVAHYIDFIYAQSVDIKYIRNKLYDIDENKLHDIYFGTFDDKKIQINPENK